jgi:hypothetical protein
MCVGCPDVLVLIVKGISVRVIHWIRLQFCKPGNLNKDKKHLLRTLETNGYSREVSERTFRRHLKNKNKKTTSY